MSEILPTGDKGYDWRLFRWSPADEKYLEYPDTGEGFKPGNAFWLIVREEPYSLRSLEGTTVATDEPSELTLLPGWNNIGNPWLFPVSWDEIENPTDANISSLYEYEGAWSDLDNITVLDPWKGYNVRNNETVSVTIKLQPNPKQRVEKAVAEDEGLQWTINIQAQADNAKDYANYIGVHKDAKVEWDRYDHVELPPVGEYMSVRFPHRDWEKYAYDYMRPPGLLVSWDFDVVTTVPRKTVTIKLDRMEQLPEHLQITLVNRDRKSTRGLLSAPSV